MALSLFIQQQLQALLETLSATEPHYIRCVKPNNLLKPAIFENSNVLQQLRCGVTCFSTKLSFHFLRTDVNPTVHNCVLFILCRE